MENPDRHGGDRDDFRHDPALRERVAFRVVRIRGKIAGMQKRWKVVVSSGGVSPELFPDAHPITSMLCAHRGLNSFEHVSSFLNPEWETGIHDPFLFSRMHETVARVFRALEQGEHITVHGDYDADGVTGSTVVVAALREIQRHLGAAYPRGVIDTYIPHRDKEGYGLHRDTVELLRERGTSLLVTVDCGIACVDEIALAKTYGMETVVLDHHQFGEILPDGFLIHPRLPGETYPFEHLAAVGVSWKFACALMTEARQRGLGIAVGWEKWLLDLVSIATVTDMVPLIGENRVLMRYGLMVLNKTRRLGLQELVSVAGKRLGELDSESIGFSLGPRINAAGRMEHAMVALDLMLAESAEEAVRLAAEIETHNRRRQKAVEVMVKEAEAMAETQADQSMVVLWSTTWSPALVGLIAGKFMERTGKPCVGIGKHGETWIGSGRSPTAAYDITNALRECGDAILTRVGGHPQACGFALVHDHDVPHLVERLHRHADARLQPEELVPELRIDGELTLEEIDWKLVETLERFEPYGVGNPRPLFLSRNLEMVECGLVGQQANHLRCTLRSPRGKPQRFIAFKQGNRMEECSIGRRFDVVYDVGVNEWHGRRDIQCKIVDFRPSESVAHSS